MYVADERLSCGRWPCVRVPVSEPNSALATVAALILADVVRRRRREKMRATMRPMMSKTLVIDTAVATMMAQLVFSEPWPVEDPASSSLAEAASRDFGPEWVATEWQAGSVAFQ